MKYYMLTLFILLNSKNSFSNNLSLNLEYSLIEKSEFFKDIKEQESTLHPTSINRLGVGYRFDQFTKMLDYTLSVYSESIKVKIDDEYVSRSIPYLEASLRSGKPSPFSDALEIGASYGLNNGQSFSTFGELTTSNSIFTAIYFPYNYFDFSIGYRLSFLQFKSTDYNNSSLKTANFFIGLKTYLF